MTDTERLRGDLRVLGLKLDAITAELRTLKAVMMGGNGRRQEAAASQRHKLGGECQAQLEAFEAVFLKVFPSTSAIDLRSSRQSGPEILWREAFAWLVGKALPHLTTGQVGTYLGRHPTGIYRQARRFEARRIGDDTGLEAEKIISVFHRNWAAASKEGGGG